MNIYQHYEWSPPEAKVEEIPLRSKIILISMKWMSEGLFRCQKEHIIYMDQPDFIAGLTTFYFLHSGAITQLPSMINIVA